MTGVTIVVKGEKYLADLAAYRGMTLEESRDLIADYQDPSYTCEGLPAGVGRLRKLPVDAELSVAPTCRTEMIT